MLRVAEFVRDRENVPLQIATQSFCAWDKSGHSGQGCKHWRAPVPSRLTNSRQLGTKLRLNGRLRWHAGSGYGRHALASLSPKFEGSGGLERRPLSISASFERACFHVNERERRCRRGFERRRRLDEREQSQREKKGRMNMI